MPAWDYGKLEDDDRRRLQQTTTMRHTKKWKWKYINEKKKPGHGVRSIKHPWILGEMVGGYTKEQGEKKTPEMKWK